MEAIPTAPLPPQAPLPPYGLARILEDTLTAPLRAAALFEELRRRPVPGWGLMLANLFLFWTAMGALNLLHVGISHPSAFKVSPTLMAGVGIAALALVLLASLLLAAVLQGVAVAAGGRQGFARSYQIVSTLSALAPLQALLNWTPVLWAAPTLLGAYAAAAGLESLGSKPLSARLLMACLALLGVGGQGLARLRVEDLARRYQAARQGLSLEGMVRRIQELPGMPPQEPMTGQAQGSPSSLEMILKTASPEGEAAPEAPLPPPGGLDSLTPLLDHPDLARDMTPEQARQMRELIGILKAQQEHLKGGKPLSPQELSEMTRRLQKLSREMLRSLPQAPPQEGDKP